LAIHHCTGPKRINQQSTCDKPTRVLKATTNATEIPSDVIASTDQHRITPHAIHPYPTWSLARREKCLIRQHDDDRQRRSPTRQAKTAHSRRQNNGSARICQARRRGQLDVRNGAGAFEQSHVNMTMWELFKKYPRLKSINGSRGSRNLQPPHPTCALHW
jgi:hypothetical protein